MKLFDSSVGEVEGSITCEEEILVFDLNKIEIVVATRNELKIFLQSDLTLIEKLKCSEMNYQNFHISLKQIAFLGPKTG